ncbi:unnamed protein product [Heligmosomoides polygyrus]|uniref:Reverse transcriptase domain-containing protein n=1 Tax=Heligmosomoides polygyrus TaxID=6339 RepID=A0A3P8B2I3_HELPZ|nr:unnamed protein product [Heligmosomoides polygyrus]
MRKLSLVLSLILAPLFTRCMAECLKVFTRVIPNRIGRTLDEGQPCEQAGFRRGFSTIDHIHTITKLIEVSREYKLPLCLTFIDLKKAFDSVEIEAVMEALCLTFIDLKKAFDSVETEAVCAPAVDSTDAKEDEFYECQQQMIDKTPRHELKIVLQQSLQWQHIFPRPSDTQSYVVIAGTENEIDFVCINNSSLDYRIATRADRNCFFSPIGCLFFSESQQYRLRQHRKRMAAVQE